MGKEETDSVVEGDGEEEGTHEIEPSRLELFSDAVFSIIATISILPAMEQLKELNPRESSVDLEEEFGLPFESEDFSLANNLIAVAAIYTIIAIQLRNHNTIFALVEKVTAPFVFLSIVYFCVLSIFPFSTSLVLFTVSFSRAQGSWLPSLLNSVVVFSFTLIQWFMSLWLYRISGDDATFSLLNRASWTLMFTVVTCMISIGLGILYPPISLDAFFLVISCWWIKRKVDEQLIKFAKKRIKEKAERENDFLDVPEKQVEKFIMQHYDCEYNEFHNNESPEPTMQNEELSSIYGSYSSKLGDKEKSGIYTSTRSIAKMMFDKTTEILILSRIQKSAYVFSKERIEGYSDGIFAIAMTLIAVNLRMPSFQEISENGVFSSMVSMWGQYLDHVLCFLVLGFQWYFHQKIIHALKAADLDVYMANHVTYLFFIAIFPLVSSYLLTYAFTDQERIATVCFCFDLIGMGLAQAWLFYCVGKSIYRDKKYHLFWPRNKKLMYCLVLTVSLAALIAGFIGIWFPSTVALVLLVLIPVLLGAVSLLFRGGFHKVDSSNPYSDEKKRLLELLKESKNSNGNNGEPGLEKKEEEEEAIVMNPPTNIEKKSLLDLISNKQ